MGLFGNMLEFAVRQIQEEIITNALQEAIYVMESMPGNAGQEAVLQDYVIPEFKANVTGYIDAGWNYVDAGPYNDFMSIICDAGNHIMDAAYQYAQSLDAFDGGGDFEIDEGDLENIESEGNFF